MRKGITILLTSIMLLTGIQPVLSLHLCGGSLFSVSLHQEVLPVTCCDLPEPAAPLSTPGFVNYHTDCCDFQSLELSTDEFSHEADHQTLRNHTPATVTLWAVMRSLLHQVLSDESQPLRQHFPPVGLGRLTTSLLTLICIYRI